MPLSKLFGLFRRTTPPTVSVVPVVPVVAVANTESVHYPPVDPGLKVGTPAEIVAANQDLIDRLKLHAAQTAELFQSRYLGPVERLAGVVNNLPATSTEHFSGQGGLFRAALEMAFQSFQAADGRIFTGKESVERRHALEGRWRYTCFVTALLYPVGSPLDNVAVTDRTGVPWRKQISGLTDWAAQRSASHVYVAWPQAPGNGRALIGPSPSVAAFVQSVVGVDNLQWLEDGSAEFVKTIFGIASGQTQQGSQIKGLLEDVWGRILEREAARRPLNYGRVVAGTHVGPYLVGALRDMVASVKAPDGDDLFMVDQTGIFLVWPDAAQAIIDYGHARKYPGWPADASTIEALLKATGIVISDSSSIGYREVIDGSGVVRSALQIANPLSIIENYDPSNYLKTPPKSLDVIERQDPLREVVQVPSPPPKTPTSKKAVVAPAAPEQVSLLDEAEPQKPTAQPSPVEHDLGQATVEGNEPPPVEVEPKTAATAAPMPLGPSENKAAVPEAPDVKFADLLPSDVRRQFRNPLIAELLGKIIKTARTEGLSKQHMRKTENGLAIQRRFLQDNIRDLNVWVDALSSAGYIYTDPKTPGRKMYDVSIPEGTKPSNAIILSHLAVKKLDL